MHNFKITFEWRVWWASKERGLAAVGDELCSSREEVKVDGLLKISPHMNYDIKGKFLDMADTTIFVRNGLHSPIIAEESDHEESKKDEEMSSVWRILKIILFVICLIVFVHQTVTLFKLYYTYPTATRTAVTRPTHFKVPSVTFCSDNPTRRSEFCGINPSICKNATQNCPNFDLQIPNFGYCTDDQKGNTSEEFMNLLCSRENFEGLCRTDMESLAWAVSKNETELTPTFVEDPEWKTLLTCLSSHLHLTDQSEGELWPLESQPQGNAIDSYKITVDRKESFFPWKEPQIFLSIHSSFIPVNPLLEGILLKTGYSYVIHVRLEEEHLLPDPYQTNCTDYEGLWRENNKTGPRSQEMCRDMCLRFTSPDSALRMMLPKDDWDAYIEMNGPWNSTDECMENCSTDCMKLKYSYSVFERISGAVDGYLPLENGEISVQILIAETGVPVTTHVPLYDFGHLISHVGGLLAFWIGISVWALIGMVEKAARKVMEWMQ